MSKWLGFASWFGFAIGSSFLVAIFFQPEKQQLGLSLATPNLLGAIFLRLVLIHDDLTHRN